jgi:hypothetical protein
VITIQSVMLVALGFLAATFLALLLAPAYRSRTVRLTTDRLRRSMPLTEEEIRADKDRLRTQYALRIHALELELEKARLSAARQRIELNRREAVIAGLEDEVGRLKADLEQHVNARRVLEQTVTERVPAIEQRLSETRALLHQRDRELAALSAEAGKTVRALDEALQLNAQQRAEIDRLMALTSNSAPRGRNGRAAAAAEKEAARAEPAPAGNGLAGPTAAAAPEVERLRATVEEQASKIRQLEAALAAYEEGDDGRMSVKGSKLAMKARISSLQSEVVSQADTIHKLRVELASANERLALQSQQYMEEMRKLGAGALPSSSASRLSGIGGMVRRGLAERIGEGQRKDPAKDKDAAPSEDGKAEAAPAPNGAPGHESTPPPTGERASAEGTAGPTAGASEPVAEKPAEVKSRPRLMDRIAGLTER